MSWKIFPITPGAKTPALEGDWRKHATSDPDVIEGWRAAGYDLAVDCGASGLFVIDIAPCGKNLEKSTGPSAGS